MLRIKRMTLLALSIIMTSLSLCFTTASLPAAQAQATLSTGDLAYVTNRSDETVSVIDTETQEVIDTIFIGKYIEHIAVTPDGKEAYVGAGDETVSVIDTKNKQITHTIPIGITPDAIAVNPNGEEVYAVDHNMVFVISTTSHEVIDTIPVGDYNNAIAVTSDGKEVYVTREGHVSVIDTQTRSVTHTITLGDSYLVTPRAIAFTPDGKQAYVSNRGKVFVIDTATKELVDSISIGENFTVDGIVFHPNGQTAYVLKSNKRNNNGPLFEVSVIDTETHQMIPSKNIPVTGEPFGIAITSDGKQVYVTNLLNDQVTVIDTKTNQVTHTISVGDNPYKITIAPKPE